MTTQNAINWPEKYLPGTGDNFVSNEVIVKGVRAADVWHHLVDTSTWESYYDNVADIGFPDGDGPVLKDGIHFRFGTHPTRGTHPGGGIVGPGPDPIASTQQQPPHRRATGS
ncbi:hypothetical protein [Streptomyces sp. PSKA30]|uniref:hypothetical protein n=1 Tax=Streptomyces sp. PSKA30 TaxID=2874597 RepID=UPI001CD16C8D|nr:hypothetical protein [Streptomyces sp. PSKA30]MBZ9640957.1 hypothetical protein [Streptomyces sp. PSKA30]